MSFSCCCVYHICLLTKWFISTYIVLHCSYSTTNYIHQFLKSIFGIKLYMFQTVPLSVIRSFSLYTQQWYLSYSFADSWRAGSIWNSVLIPLASCQQTCMTYTIAVCTVKTPDDGQRNCPKHVEFYSKNKFEKLVHLVGFIIRIYHDARSPERQILHHV